MVSFLCGSLQYMTVLCTILASFVPALPIRRTSLPVCRPSLVCKPLKQKATGKKGRCPKRILGKSGAICDQIESFVVCASCKPSRAGPIHRLGKENTTQIATNPSSAQAMPCPAVKRNNAGLPFRVPLPQARSAFATKNQQIAATQDTLWVIYAKFGFVPS